MGQWISAKKELSTSSNRDSTTINYLVRYIGTDLSANPTHNEQAKDYLWYSLPSQYDEMYLVDIDLEQLSHENPVSFLAQARYSGRPIGSIEWEFAVTGESEHISYALENIGVYKAHYAADPPDHGLLINVKSDLEVEGVDIQAPTHKFSITYTNVFTTFDEVYIKAVQDLVGTVNGTVFFNYEIGEILFTGFDGKLTKPTTRGEHNTSSLRFQFERSKNKLIRLDGFSTFEKRGWDYMWMSTNHKRDSPGNAMAKEIKAIHVQRVYEYTDFRVMRLEN